MAVEKSKFEHVYKQLLHVTYEKYPDTVPLFNTGLWREEEFYKYDVWDKARAALQLDTWEFHKDDPRYCERRIFSWAKI